MKRTSNYASPPPEEPKLKIQSSEAAEKIQKQIRRGEELLGVEPRTEQEIDRLIEKKSIWNDFNKDLLKSIFTTESIAIEYTAFHGSVISMSPFGADRARYVKDSIRDSITKLQSIFERLELYHPPVAAEEYDKRAPIVRIENLCTRFHLVVKQLRSRHEGRSTLDVSDEYDVQDLLHALLRLDFEDIRPEECTPSYAGKSSRMDFLLKREKIVIEVKMAGPTRKAKDIGNELIEDIARYRNYLDCERLICFVYDPKNTIANPRGIEGDLERQGEFPIVTVLIRPL